MGFLRQVTGVVARGFSNLRKNSYFTVAIIGRPNVGKSTLFNRLVGKKLSLVDNLPGLTRDRIESTTSLFGVGIKFVDTAGWDPYDTPNSPTIVQKMIQQTHNALKLSHLSLFLLDCKAGVTAADNSLARWLHARRKGPEDDSETKDIVLVANKAESNYTDDFENRVFRLGFGEPVYISAAQGDGMVDLYERIRDKIPASYFEEQEAKTKRISVKYQAYKSKFEQELNELETQLGESINKRELLREFEALNPSDMSELDSDTEYDPEKIIARPALPGEARSSKSNKPIQIAIIGRPNVGKSTFVNALLKSDRVIADQMPGTTRDSVYTEFNHEGRNIILVDTAGLVKHPDGKLPTMIKEEVHRAIKYSQVVVLLFDSMTALTTMDLDLARQTVFEGRALIVAGNKWDLVSTDWKKKAADFMAEQLRKTVDVKGLPLLFLSAKECSRMGDFMSLVVKTYDKWNMRVSTGYLNRWLGAFKKVQSLPSGGGEKLTIKYMTQVKSRPPTFYVVVNNKDLMKDNYLKNFKSALSKEFGLEGIAIRILLRDGAAQKKEKEKTKKLKPGLFVNSKPVGRSALFEGLGKRRKWKEEKAKSKAVSPAAQSKTEEE